MSNGEGVRLKGVRLTGVDCICSNDVVLVIDDDLIFVETFYETSSNDSLKTTFIGLNKSVFVPGNSFSHCVITIRCWLVALTPMIYVIAIALQLDVSR